MTQLAHMQRAGHGVQRWYATQIAASCKKGDWASALQLLQNMYEQKMQASAAMCNKIITTCIENKQLESALMALGIVRLMDVVPDATTYSTLIRICEKRGMADAAWQLFEDMKKNNLTTNVITYNALIRAAEELRLPFEKANDLLTQMKESNVQLDINSYNALISISLADSSRPDSIEVALDLFMELHDAGLTPNVITYKTLFGVVREDSDGMLADGRIFAEMERRGILPDISTYNSLISSCERGKHPERALVLFDALQRQGLQPDRATYNALIGICKKKKQPERAARLLDSMQDAGIDPDIDTYNAVIGACSRKDQAELAIRYFQDLQSRGLEPNILTFNAVFAALTRREVSGDMLDRLVDSMACYGLQPDKATYVHLMTACASSQDVQRALKWLNMMRAHGIPVDGDIRNIISSIGIVDDIPHEEEAWESLSLSRFCSTTSCSSGSGSSEGEEREAKINVEVDPASFQRMLASWQLLQIPHKAPPGLTPQFPVHPLLAGNWCATN